MVCLYVGLLVCLPKTAEPIRDAFCVVGSGGLKEPCVRWEYRSSHVKGQFLGERTCPGMPGDTVP